MEKSLKKRLNSRSQKQLRSNSFGIRRIVRSSAACALSAAAVLFSVCAFAQEPSGKSPAAVTKPKSIKVSTHAPTGVSASAGKPATETYRNLIEKAQNLSLQKDRLQASQILVRAIAGQLKSSPAYKELTRALDELMTTFYTERAQSTFVSGESNLPEKPREAIDAFTEALHQEDGNVTILKAIARTHLILAECDKADTFVKQAEALDPYAAEVLLLRLQVLDCQKSDLLADKIDLTLDQSVHGLQIRELVREGELKKAHAVLAAWEKDSPEYPEVYFWKWSLAEKLNDKASAQKYVQLCQNLTPRKRKSYNLDVDLCKGKEAVDKYLKELPHAE